MRNGLVASACVLLFGATLVPAAYAQDTAAAEALFRSARQAADQGDWVTACDRFEESKRLEPAPGTVLNLARCREALGQVASAWKSYNEAAQRLPVGDERHDFARKKSLELEARVPHLTLDAPETTVEIVVTIDGTRLSSASFGVPLPFDPGELNIVVQADGHENNATEVALAEGDDVRHQLKLGPTSAGSRSEASGDRAFEGESFARKQKKASVPFFVLGGVGAAAAVSGGIWAGIEHPKVKDEKNCVEGFCKDFGADAAARGRIAVYLLGAGSVLAVGGVGVGAYFLAKEKEATVSLTPLPGGGAVFWRTDL